MSDGRRTCVAQGGGPHGKHSGFNMTFDNRVMVSANYQGDCSDDLNVAVLCDPGKDGQGKRVWLTDRVAGHPMNEWDVETSVNTDGLAKLIQKAARLSPSLCKRG